MPTVMFGNNSVLEPYKPDPDVAHVESKLRPDLGKRVTTMSLNEVDGDDNPSPIMNVAMAQRLWANDSDKVPAWVECETEPMLAEMIAHQMGCKVGRPRSWKEG